MLLAFVLLVIASPLDAQDAGVPSWRPTPFTTHPENEPSMLSIERCGALVRGTRARDLVHPRRVQLDEADDMPGVAFPVRLVSTILGVVVGAHAGHGRPRPIEGDCRLFAAIAAWAPTLRAAGIDRIGHLSLYRPDARVEGRGVPSGHAVGLAIDLAHFVFDDGTDFVVRRDWADRTRGASPCGDRAGEDAHMTAVRSVVCAASDAARFNVVLTPHYDDDHQSHVHLEVRPGMTGLVLH